MCLPIELFDNSLLLIQRGKRDEKVAVALRAHVWDGGLQAGCPHLLPENMTLREVIKIIGQDLAAVRTKPDEITGKTRAAEFRAVPKRFSHGSAATCQQNVAVLEQIRLGEVLRQRLESIFAQRAVGGQIGDADVPR